MSRREQPASRGGGGEGQDADSEEEPGGWLGHLGWGKREAVDCEWSDVYRVVGVEDIDVIGAVVVDVGETGSDRTVESEENAERVDVCDGGIGEG